MLWLFLTLQVWAAEPGLVGFYPPEVLRNEIVEFKSLPSYHFSPDAPQGCGSGALLERSPRQIKCQFSTAGATSVQLNVCDDKKTFCKAQELKVQVIDRPVADVKSLQKNEVLNEKLKHVLIPGFNESRPEQALAQASARGEPVLVMVSTDWCPSCNELKEFLLSSASFQMITQTWYKIYVDGDSLQAARWEKIVPYNYFPSLVLLNPQMQEVGRFTGEIRQSDFEAWSKETLALLDDPIVTLQPRVLERFHGSWKRKFKDFWNGVSSEKKAKEAERLLRWALDRGDNGLVDTLVAGNFPALAPEILHYRLTQLEHREQLDGVDLKAPKIELYKELLAKTVHLDHWSDNLQGLCELDVASCKPYLSQIQERLDFLLKSPGLLEAEKESQLGQEYLALAEVYQAVGQPDVLKDFALKCVDHFEAMKKRSILKVSRASQQGMVACMELAETYPREETALKVLIEAYPNEPTFLFRMARMLAKQKNAALALTYVRRAEALAYGYNWFNLEMLKANLLLDLKQSDQAKTVLRETLAQINLEPGQGSRNQSLVARLRALQSKVNETVQN